MPFLKRPGATIYYDVIAAVDGASEASFVTLINGHTRTTSDFKMMAKFFGEHGFTVILMDNRGAGRTVVENDFNLDDIALDVVSVWDHLKIDRSHLLGISMGGMIAQWVAIHYLERVQRLVLVSTCPNRTFIRDDGSYAWSDNEKQIVEKLTGYFSAGFLAGNRLLVEAMAKQMAKSARDGAFLQNSSRQMQALEGFNALPLLSRIIAKTLILHGSEDGIVRPEAASLLAQEITGSTLKIFLGAGHLLLAERPKELYGVSLDYFEGR